MSRPAHSNLEAKVDIVIELLRYLVAIELSRSGASRAAIGKHVRVAKAQVVKMLRDVRKEK